METSRLIINNRVPSELARASPTTQRSTVSMDKKCSVWYCLVGPRGLFVMFNKKEYRVGRVFVGHRWAVLCTSTLQACNCVKLQAGHQGITHVLHRMTTGFGPY